MSKIALLLIALYVVAGFLTYGHSYNRGGYKFPSDQNFDAFVAGAFWPLYWAGYPIGWVADAATNVTKRDANE